MSCSSRSRIASVALALALAAGPGHAGVALPEAARELAPQWRALGAGQARWFGLMLYDAALWVGGTTFSEERAFALALRYARDFSRAQLVSSSIDEMRRISGADEARLAVWEQDLQRVFPDVKAGEVIVGVSLPGRGALFFHQGRPSGEVADTEFARAFFSIWLDGRTRVPDLRRQLLGLK